jgi:hypothetical protein
MGGDRLLQTYSPVAAKPTALGPTDPRALSDSWIAHSLLLEFLCLLPAVYAPRVSGFALGRPRVLHPGDYPLLIASGGKQRT